MARRLRLQFPGAIYHLINRGNYRRDVFETAGAAKAFEQALDEACQRFGWLLHAYVIMRNHYHLALETPEANLVEGMHWLQSGFATRFNRFRSERGHLFQGRYQALVIEDAVALARVVNYIHRNPVRAKIVAVEQIQDFRWSSLGRFLRAARPGWLVAADWLAAVGLEDNAEGWRRYIALLTDQAAASDGAGAREELCRGWAIGTQAWREALAKDYAQMSLQAGIASSELQDIRQARWQQALDSLLQQTGKTLESARNDTKSAPWKRSMAAQLRREAGAPHRWIAQTLHMGSPNSVRSYVSRGEKTSNQQLSA